MPKFCRRENGKNDSYHRKSSFIDFAHNTFHRFFMLRNPHSFENGATLAFYSFLVCLVSGIITFIARIIVSQRG